MDMKKDLHATKAANSYLKRFLKTYQTAYALTLSKKQEQAHYRIVRLPDEQDKNLHFQIIGKSIILKMLPEQIMRDDLLLAFSRAEIAIITHLGTKGELLKKQPRAESKLLKITKQLFSYGKTRFLVENPQGEVTEYAAIDLCDDNMADKLTGSDGIKVGYTVAEERYQQISQLKEKE